MGRGVCECLVLRGSGGRRLTFITLGLMETVTFWPTFKLAR